MRVTVALMLVLTAAETVMSDDEAMKISKVDYIDSATTQVCVGVEIGLRDVRMTYKIGDGSAGIQNSKGVTNGEETTCADFTDAPIPSDGDNVEYLVFLVEKATETVLEQSAVTFNFELKPKKDSFKCGGTDYTRQTTVDPANRLDNCLDTGKSDTCYKQEKPADDGCTASGSGFEYCQPAGTNLDSGELGGTALEYKTTKFTFETFPADTTDVLIFNSKDEAVVSVYTSGKEVVATGLMPSSETYTLCAVTDAKVGEDEITDMNVNAVVNSFGTDDYFEFGFDYLVDTQSVFQAATGTEQDMKTVNIDCSNLEAGDRCYGYLKKDGSSDFTVSYVLTTGQPGSVATYENTIQVTVENENP